MRLSIHYYKDILSNRDHMMEHSLSAAPPSLPRLRGTAEACAAAGVAARMNSRMSKFLSDLIPA